MSTGTVCVVAHLVARPETVAAVRAGLLRLLEPTRGEAGCVAYELFENTQDATDFTFVESWRSDADIDAHMKTPHLQQVIAEVVPLLGAAPDIRRYRLLG